MLTCGRLDGFWITLGFHRILCTTDAILLVRRLQEKYLGKRKSCTLHLLAWRRLLTGYHMCWTMRKLGIEEWLVNVVQAMWNNKNAIRRVRFNGTLSEEFVVKVGVYQGSVPSPFFSSWYLQYCHVNSYQVLIEESMEELVMEFKKWDMDKYEEDKNSGM